ncbi:restriction endonuclease [Lactobacillus helveticus]|uniref:Type III restriction endonuclease subunit R n=3 Tax=Lactobacillus helveticus TaxID=1587 RepID=A0AAV4E663_LACHE|nr:DEAD/DEAH box helicase family protein [Lactobacillus helveticus]MBW7979685.1 DEAD/DEAH box helicase [Lactobacillus helveticus]GFP11504.1 type III restriction endonuclease subunit R [Lactobacillus helveticus]GFP13077.1 type III restriction endonuclease subunit R [Lactobacillus helveticus]
MKINYEKLPYQQEAVKAVIDTLSDHNDVGNKMILDPEILDDSVKQTLLDNEQKYPGSDYLTPFPQFNIEMETGTGKTMVYLQTIVELHKRFHENKFIIVVPSRAIKAGVEDSLNKLKDYLSDIYNTDKYHYFLYDSKQILELQNFEGDNFEIMLTTIQAFNKSTNIINQEYNEGFFGGRPLDQIKEAKPIVIIDEPQSVDSAKAGKKAIASLNPKLVLRYSATHKEKQYPMLYEYGPVQAYKDHMVKHIETLGTDIDTNGNIPFIELKERPEFKNDRLQAKVIAYKQINDDFEKRTIILRMGDSLAKKTNNSRYEKLGKVTVIDSANDFIEFENGYHAEVGALEGENDIWVSAQMEALVRDHLDRELNMQDQGIKVLSLIFLDQVKNYRVYTKDGPKKGIYADLFEKTYEKVLHSNPKYKKLNDYNVPVDEVHDGYFAQDKATKNKPAMYRDTKGDTAKDETAYDAIMDDKEGLLTKYIPGKPETNTKAAKLRFIFSHSALKEGWDNPNVFQILTIATPKNDLTRRQKIGRGLRIPVNQEGKRVYYEKQNVVTIYANETFEEFAAGLQNEYLDSGLLSNKIDEDFFTNIVVSKNDSLNNEEDTEEEDKTLNEEETGGNNTRKITHHESATFTQVLKQNNIINSNSKPTARGLNTLSDDNTVKKIVNQTVEAGVEIETAKKMINVVINRFSVPEPTNRRKRKKVQLIGKNNDFFDELWNKISYKVKYRVNFDEDKLINSIVNGNNPLKDIKLTRMTALQTRARVNLNDTNVNNKIISQNTEHLTWNDMPIMDITRQLADKTGLTKKAIIKMILLTNQKDNNFIKKIKMNPALFVNRAYQRIRMHEQNLLSHSLVYIQTGEKWSKDLFKSFDASDNTLWKVPESGLNKTLFNQIPTQSQEERKFAESLINEKKIKYFFKLPNWFKIPTPFGNYNPDWAILAETNGVKKLYFVIDTKTTEEKGTLRSGEQTKLSAGAQAYKAEGFEDVRFEAPIKVIGDLDL